VPLAELDPTLTGRVILHPICTAKRTSSCNMIFLLLSVVTAMIFVVIRKVRHRLPVGSLTHSEISREDLSITKVRAEQSSLTDPMKQFMVVVLPDGMIVTPKVTARA
jgi:hypothetical protein